MTTYYHPLTPNYPRLFRDSCWETHKTVYMTNLLISVQLFLFRLERRTPGRRIRAPPVPRSLGLQWRARIRTHRRRKVVSRRGTCQTGSHLCLLARPGIQIRNVLIFIYYLSSKECFRSLGYFSIDILNIITKAKISVWQTYVMPYNGWFTLRMNSNAAF